MIAAAHEALQRAFAFHGAGNLAEAERHYRLCLDAIPDHFDALHWLGVLEAQRGHFDASEELLGKAVAINPGSPEAHTNRANVLKALGRFEAALASYDKALAIRPDFPEVLSNRGAVLQDLAHHEEALASYDRALELRPSYAEALNNRGNTLAALARYEDALASFDRALAVKSDYADALSNRGVVQQQIARYGDALASFDRALAIRPNYAEALGNRANTLCSMQRYQEALADCDAALSIAPSFAEALNNRGNALRGLKRHADALSAYDKASAIRPDDLKPLNNRAHLLRELNRYEEALATCNQALTIQPDCADALVNRAQIWQSLGRYDNAALDFQRALELDPALPEVPGALLHARMHACDWRTHEAETARLVADARDGRHTCPPFVFLTVSDSPQDQVECARSWVRAKAPPTANPMWNGERYHHDRVRVAYLSADFHEHATMHLIAGLLERHDRARFEITALSFGPDDPRDPMQARARAAVERFIDARALSDESAAKLLRDGEIDIAVDLKGFTTDSRPGILAWRPSPVQVSYLGYPGTMAADYVDYLLADAWVIPRDHEPWYSENIVRLPHCYQANDATRRIATRTPSRAEAGLPGEGFVFCCFNNSYKISPLVFDRWMRLLGQVDGSVLWLLESNVVAPANLRREASARGIAPERLIFAPPVRPEDHLARHRLADLFLDTLPYNAHTTASDALWAELPVLTCTGTTFAGRVAGSLLHALGLPQLVTRDLDEYEALALDLAMRPEHLAAIKRALADHRRQYPLFDTELFRRHIESAYLQMWERYQRGEEPAGFALNP